MRQIMLKKLLVSAFLLAAGPAFSQSVQYVSPVTRGHLAAWNTNGVLADGGTSASSPITSVGITNNGGAGLCINSALPTTPGYQALCFGASTAGPATISLQNFGSASPQGLNFVINGTTLPFPGAIASLIVGNTPVSSGTNGNCLSISSAILSQVPCTILAAGTTGTGAVVLQNSPTLAGTIGGNLSFSGNETFTGNVTAASQFIVNGVSTPASISNQTVIMGSISPPTLANTGQAWLFNQAVAGATLQGDGSSFDITLVNKNGGVAMQIPTGTTGITFPGVLTLSGLSSGTCVSSVVLNSLNQTVTGSCPGAASTIQVGSTAVTSGTSNNILFNNAGTLGNETIASILTGGTGISITGTTNATIALTTPVSATNGGSGVSNPTAHAILVGEGSSAFASVGPGTLGQFEGAQGASADPAYTSGPWTLLATLPASSSATLTDTTHITSSYAQYEIVFEDILPATNAVSCEIQFYIGGILQTSGYSESNNGAGTGGTFLGQGSASTTFIPCSYGSSAASAGPGQNGSIRFNRPSVSVIHPVWGTFSGNAAGNGGATENVAGYFNTAGTITGINVLFSAGNIASGNVKIYGRL
jgi:hypothetical protein